MTKEEILDSRYFPKMHWKSVNRVQVLLAMDEFAKETAIGFAEWINKERYMKVTSVGVLWGKGNESTNHTTEQLFQLYLQSIKDK